MRAARASGAPIPGHPRRLRRSRARIPPDPPPTVLEWEPARTTEVDRGAASAPPRSRGPTDEEDVSRGRPDPGPRPGPGPGGERAPVARNGRRPGVPRGDLRWSPRGRSGGCRSDRGAAGAGRGAPPPGRARCTAAGGAGRARARRPPPRSVADGSGDGARRHARSPGGRERPVRGRGLAVGGVGSPPRPSPSDDRRRRALRDPRGPIRRGPRQRDEVRRGDRQHRPPPDRGQRGHRAPRSLPRGFRRDRRRRRLSRRQRGEGDGGLRRRCGRQRRAARGHLQHRGGSHRPPGGREGPALWLGRHGSGRELPDRRPRARHLWIPAG